MQTNDKCHCHCLHVLSFGLALGLLWGIIVLSMGLVGDVGPFYGSKFVEALGTMYVGYNTTIIGSIN